MHMYLLPVCSMYLPELSSFRALCSVIIADSAVASTYIHTLFIIPWPHPCNCALCIYASVPRRTVLHHTVPHHTTLIAHYKGTTPVLHVPYFIFYLIPTERLIFRHVGTLFRGNRQKLALQNFRGFYFRRLVCGPRSQTYCILNFANGHRLAKYAKLNPPQNIRHTVVWEIFVV